MYVIDSQYDFATTVKRLEESLIRRGMTIYSTIDHKIHVQSDEERIGPIKILLFGNPPMEEHFIKDNIMVSLEFPLRIGVKEEDGAVTVFYKPLYRIIHAYSIERDQEVFRMITLMMECANEAASAPIQEIAEKKQLYSFAMRWYKSFAYYLLFHFEDKLGDECKALGFELYSDFGNIYSLEQMYGIPLLDFKMFKEDISFIDEPRVLGNAIYMAWRYWTHWANSPIDEEGIEWFRLAFKRLAELTEIESPSTFDYVYYGVHLLSGSPRLYYRAKEPIYQLGDYVYVPVGITNEKMLGQISSLEYYEAKDVPYPVEKLKWILGHHEKMLYEYIN